MKKVGYVYEATALLLLLFVCLYTIGMYSKLPPTVPTHFDFAGVPNAWGARGAIWFIPGVSVFLYLLVTGAAWLAARHPEIVHYPAEVTETKRKSQNEMAIVFLQSVKMYVMLIFAIISLFSVQTALQQHPLSGMGLVLLMVVVMLAFHMSIYIVIARKSK